MGRRKEEEKKKPQGSPEGPPAVRNHYSWGQNNEKERPEPAAFSQLGQVSPDATGASKGQQGRSWACCRKLVAGAQLEQEDRGSLGLHSPPSIPARLLEAGATSAGVREIWLTESQPQHHRAEYTWPLELRDSR